MYVYSNTIYTHTHTHMSIYLYLFYIYIYMNIQSILGHMCIYIYIYLSCVWIYIPICVYTHSHIYIYTYIYTYIHIHMRHTQINIASCADFMVFYKVLDLHEQTNYCLRWLSITSLNSSFLGNVEHRIVCQYGITVLLYLSIIYNFFFIHLTWYFQVLQEFLIWRAFIPVVLRDFWLLTFPKIVVFLQT